MSESELERKMGRLQALLAERKLDALLLQRVSSFAWATGGAASYVNAATTSGPSLLLITPAGRYVVTNNIEAPRLEREERLAEQGWAMRVAPWHEPHSIVGDLTRGMRLGSDGAWPGATDLSGDLARLRARLEPEEIVRFRELGQAAAAAIDAAVQAIRPGLSEHEIAGLLAQQAQRRGVQAIVNLVAADERIKLFRHPLPTARRLERYAMLVLAGRRRGLVCSVTRLVHFGPLTAALRHRVEAVAQVDAALIAATRPGQALADIFHCATAAYAAAGYPGEWQHHHQGGAAGYEPREYLATPASTDIVCAGQAYAWNPSIAGAKSEDTILVADAGPEVLTAMPGWPMLSIAVGGQTFLRPAVLEIL